MNLYIYSDESGVFDKVHNQYFVFGGLIFLDKNGKNVCARKYSAAEKLIRKKEQIAIGRELKATTLSNAGKGKLYRSLNQCHKFGIVIRQKSVMDRIFASKKDKQRYLDFAYKIGVKRKLEDLIKQGKIVAEDVERLYFYVDEHTTATNGCYELREGLESEFKNGTYNFDYNTYYPPVFPNLKEVSLHFCDSASNGLIRAADIIANRIYYATVSKTSVSSNNLLIAYLP